MANQPLRDRIAKPRESVDGLFPLVYDELRRLAHAQLNRFRPGDTLSTTALVHEAYLKLVGNGRVQASDRRAFFALAAGAMRQIIVDYARRQTAGKRGGGVTHTPLEAMDQAGGVAVQVEAQAISLLALDRALGRLSHLDKRLARVVELRFFAGLSVDEAAELLQVATATVKRDTRAARAFLAREIGAAPEAGGGA